MLSSYSPVATLPTKDLAKARAFYEETLVSPPPGTTWAAA
jgi:hypothetical protein